MLPIKQTILLVELSYVVLSDDRLTNAIKTLLQSRILFLKILNSQLVNTGHSLFNLQRVDFIILLSLSPRHNWSGNTLLFSGALLTFTFRLAASLNCLVSPSLRELKPYPQSSLYNLCHVVPSPAFHSTSLHPRRSDHHYSGHGKQHCIPPCHCWSILRYYSSSNFSWIWFPPPLHM